MQNLLRRYDNNPILTIDDLPEGSGYYILNPGATRYHDEYLLLVDVFTHEGGINFYLARSTDGFHFKFDPEPVAWESPDPAKTGWHEHGVYDPRITRWGDEYIIMYNSHDQQ